MEEEISLRELIETVLKGKKLIVITTLAAMFIAALLTFLPKRTPPAPQYRAEANIRIERLAPEGFNPESGGYFPVLISTLMNAGRYNAEVFAELVRHPNLLAAVRRDLALDERGIPQGFLAKSLEASVDSTKTALTVGLTHPDPAFAREIVNTVSEKIEGFLAARQRERIDLVASNLERLIALELQGLRSTLKRLEETRASFDPLITYRDNSHLTPEYAVLSNDIARIISQISQLEAQQEEIKDFRVSVTALPRKVDDWVIFTPASTATEITPEPARPRSLNIIIAGVLGLIVSVFTVFFLDYWKKSARASTTTASFW